MPKLSPIQWIVFILFLAFYGFAVFALTRDYCLRNPAAIVATARSPHTLPETQQRRTWIQDAMQPGEAVIPPAVTESNPILLQQKADELFAGRRYEEAIPLYRRLIELDPQDPDSYNDLGLALHYSGRSRAGLEVLRTGTARNPGFQRIWLSLGFVSEQSGGEAEAAEALQKARDLNPDNNVGQEATRLLGLLKKK